ncbi:hypothetical protein ACHAWO_001345 [Cyclotella atomus]|uniref:HMG box domain-containing protein n=1 Tax=Cyclotella atomus TaxID=382360 RepID=A0ABD3PQ35_9STRA
MPRPTMLPPSGYGYPSAPPSSYYMSYRQRGPPPPQFQNPKIEGEDDASYHPPPRYAPQFINAPAANNDLPPPLPSGDQVKAAKSAESGKKKSSKKKDEDDPNKKPPRPYTEYNIFFQLERERMLMDLEKDNQIKELGYVKEEEIVYNQPSDENDVLPRPPRFAHLTLLPKWYDSKHRLAESKKNKEKRKHRKTHGLVGFLDLTRRIAKEWSEAEEDVKSYCKRVALRQLGYYKDELKVWKKTQEAEALRAKKEDDQEGVTENDALIIIDALDPSSKKTPESAAAERAKLPQVIHRSMPPPPAQQYPPHAQRNMHWQSSQHPHGHYVNRNYPAMPVLSPSMDYHDDYRYHPMPVSNRHPLDELMHRRNLYGSRTAMMHSSRARKRNTQGVVLESRDMKQEVISPSEGKVKETSSFLSPEDTGSPNNDANTAITPSPSRSVVGDQDHLPMKKRRKKMSMPGDDLGVSDVSPGSFGDSSPGSGTNVNDTKLSPLNFSPSEGMIMTPNGEAFMGQMMGVSPSLGQWSNESPGFPYIDCFSPQEGSGAPRVDAYRRPSVASMYPQSPYIPASGQWGAPPMHHYPFDSGINMATNPEDDFDDSEALDLDDEELQLMRRLQATRAKKLRQKHQFMQQHAVGSHEWAFAQSPGGPMFHNYSFASPVEKPSAADAIKK